MANIPGNQRESIIAFGKGKQADIATANIAANMWRLLKLNAGSARPRLVKENDAAEFGKGHEFATQEFKSHKEVGFTIEKYLSAEIMAWAAGFGLGNCVKSGGPQHWVYTCSELDLTAGLELPYFSFVEQVRSGASPIEDYMVYGLAVESFQVTLGYGPGRASSRIAIEVVGAGKETAPSAIVIPAATAELLLPAASLAFAALTVDYVTLKNILSVSWGWKNNIRLDQGFYPGSGTQDGYAVRGRLEVGDRVPNLSFRARMTNDSAEYAALRDLTTGTAVITQTYDANNTYTATFQKVAFATRERADENGLVTVDVVCTPMHHSSNGVLDVVAKCDVDGICQAP